MKYLLLFFLFCSFECAEKILETLTVEEKIGQLFVVPASPLRGEDHFQDLAVMISEYHIGGIIMKQGSPNDYRLLMNRLNDRSKKPLLYFADAEWGLGMRMSDTISYPKNLELGAIIDNTLITRLGKEIGRQCRAVGIHVNLAPVVDINTNPQNPIINERSFGSDPYEVAKKSVAYIQGLEMSHVMACAKHFPGHGDTSSDSHFTLPLVPHSRERLENIELIPFQAMIANKIPLIMTGHLHIPALSIHPVTFSYEIVTQLLKNKMGFEGLVITDALNMKALTALHSPSEIALRALFAGHDLLLYGDHIAPNVDDILRRQIPAAYKAILQAYQQGALSKQELDAHVLKILKAKETILPATNEELNTEEALLLKEILIQAAKKGSQA